MNAETALAETAAMQTGGRGFPKPGKYDVRSTGAEQQVPLGAEIDIILGPQGIALAIAGDLKGPVTSLENGDYKVEYTSGGFDMVLQFRQSDADAYLYGISMPLEVLPTAGDDPPITGVWGAEARPGLQEPEG